LPELLQLSDLEVRIPRFEVVTLERIAVRERRSVDRCWRVSCAISSRRSRTGWRRRSLALRMRFRGRGNRSFLIRRWTQMYADRGVFYLRTSASSADGLFFQHLAKHRGGEDARRASRRDAGAPAWKRHAGRHETSWRPLWTSWRPAWSGMESAMKRHGVRY